MTIQKPVAIALLLGLAAAGCTSESSKKEATYTETSTNKPAKGLPDAEIEPVQKPDSLYSYELPNDPFGIGTQSQPTADSYLSKIKGAYTIRKNPVQNRHANNVTDTVLTVSANNSKIELYKAADKVILLSATIKNPDIALRDGFAVGMHKSELLNRLNELSYKWAAKGKNVTVADEMGLTNLKFILAHDQVSRIDYEGYVD